MTIIKEYVPEEEVLFPFQEGETVMLFDSPYDRLKKRAKGKIQTIHGDPNDPNAMLTVRFRVNKQDFDLYTGSRRFRHIPQPAPDEELPDAENPTPNLEDDLDAE